MPSPWWDAGTLNITFYAASPGVTYTVMTSTNLCDWTIGGVLLSAFDPFNQRTASVAMTGPAHFLKLVVAQ
jgi:hypothetical protein